ncbi:Alcohol dehydrogenase [NADP(+)] [Micractinium conductrix]|uniref:Alcohol dehydrogenase [NADP(+)] n=1 Tax=Micractinium conductrix TaxID=554055 RepID=A0A2P6VCA4_9CHLO|nr:Alcohol dehydrogenase [NADP(+)] [Micractinium conductrix]|eukprot:PSC71722.1 Alcohol dehydrogenase [NADP(+)] [Micractinium conductrix]
MASDGCQPVDWAGKGGFTHLMHHPGFMQTENYGSARHGHSGAHAHEEEEASSSGRGDRTGVWNGPAPRGYSAQPMHAQDESAAADAAAKPVNDPPHVILPGSTHMPLIGLGTYKLQSPGSVKAALEIGYRHIDCASVYANEAVVGEGLKDFIAAGGRAELFITSKVWNDAHRPAELRKSVEQSVSELGCSYLDLCLVHWPDAFKPGSEEPDTEVTLQQTWQAMESLVDDGLVRHIGVSNYSLRQVEETLSYARIKPVVNQVELHPLLAQRKLVGVCLRNGVHSVAYSPLGHTGPDSDVMAAAAEVAAEVGKTPAQVLLKWNVQRGVAVIPKASSEPHLRENFEGLFNWRLTWDQKAKLDALDRGQRFVTSSWHTWEDPEEGGAAKPSLVL